MARRPPTSSPRWAAHLPPGSAPDDLDLLAGGSLVGAWTARWAEDPATAVLCDVGSEWVSAGELEERSRRVAGRLRAAGLVHGDRMVLSAEPSVDVVVAYVAALRLGLVVVPVNAAYREREVAHIVADARPAAAVVDDEERGAWVVRASNAPVVVASPAMDLPDGAGDAAVADVVDRVTGDDVALIGYTSGTTGAPKGAMLTHGNLLAGAHAVRVAWRWTPADRLVLALPLFHMHGLGVGVNATLVAGASAVIVPRFAVDPVLDAAAEHDATLFFGVPTMYARLAASPRLGELARFRLCVSGSAPLAAALHAAVEGGGHQRVLERYGMTETVMNVSNPYDGERRPGSVGLPLPGVELRLDGEPDEPGEILVKGPNVFPGYWERPDATADAFDGDGWFRTGDVGALDDDGYLRIVGRRKELIISGGFNVYPREVEDVLRGHPDVADVAVVGTASDEWGEVVTAYVVPDGPEDAAALVAFAAARLAAFKRPKLVHYVGDLPRNALGKVLKHELAPDVR